MHWNGLEILEDDYIKSMEWLGALISIDSEITCNKNPNSTNASRIVAVFMIINFMFINFMFINMCINQAIFSVQAIGLISFGDRANERLLNWVK